jgi:hypothetical protein
VNMLLAGGNVCCILFHGVEMGFATRSLRRLALEGNDPPRALSLGGDPSYPLSRLHPFVLCFCDKSILTSLSIESMVDGR